MDRCFHPKLIAEICLYVFDHAFPVGAAKKIGLANENHGAGAGLVERLHDDEIVLRETGASIDQDDPKIAPRQVCNRFFGTGNGKRAKPRRIDKGHALPQPIGR